LNNPQEQDPVPLIEDPKLYNIDDEPDLETEVFVLQEMESQDSPINIEESHQDIKEIAANLISQRISNKEECDLLTKMIRNNEEIIRIPLEIFQQSKDEEDFIDTLMRLLKKFKKKDSKELKPQNLNIKPPQIEEQPIKNQANKDNSRNEMQKKKPFDFIGFLEQNSEKFSNEEYGIMVYLKNKNDDELQAIIFQCQNIKNSEVSLYFFSLKSHFFLISWCSNSSKLYQKLSSFNSSSRPLNPRRSNI